MFLPILAESGIHFLPFSWGAGIGVPVLILLLIASGLISGSEAAFFSLTPSELRKLENSPSRNNKLALELLHNPEKLLGSLLIANNFINISVVILSTYITHSLIDFSDNHLMGFLFQAVVITFIILLFGEIVPKIYATHKAYSFVLFMASPVKVLYVVFLPCTRLLVRSTKIFKPRIIQKKTNISLGDLSSALELTSESITEDKSILEGIVKFGNIEVRNIMRSRQDIVAAELRLSMKDIVQIVNESGFSRIPIYFESLDHVRGILYIKDLLPHLGKNDAFKWQSLIRPPYYVPEVKRISDLLHEFQINKIHMALVIDEFGGTSGLITLEDILEEIIGEIMDESDETDDPLYTRLSDHEYVFKGKTLLNDFCKITDTDEEDFDLVKGEADTLAGLILEIKGELPATGTVIPFGHFLFRIESADDRKISKIKVTINNA